MADQDDDSEKSHEATQHKLDEARKKGDLARSADLDTSAAYAGFLLASLAIGGAIVDRVGTNLMMFLNQPVRLSDLVFNDGASQSGLAGILGHVVASFSTWLLVPAVAVLVSVIAQHSFVIAPSKIEPKLSRINPVENVRNKYGPRGIFEFAKSLTKLVLYCAVLSAFLLHHFSDIAGTLFEEPRLVASLMAGLLIEFLLIVTLISAGIAAIDYLWQRYDHLRRQRMSQKEIRDEFKQNEGDPHMKQQRRQRGMQITSKQIMAEVPKADVVIMNPTHYAVALKWSRAPGSAPVCIAKGMDHVALTIRDIAFENGIPVRQDAPTARALYASTDIGQEIDPSLYRSVASAIRFADAMRRKAGKSR